MRFGCLLALVAVLLAPWPALAAAPSARQGPPEVVPVTPVRPLPAELKHVLTRMRDVGGFSARFTQILRFPDGQMQTYRGDVEVLRPGRFRWHYTEPYEQLYISDGSEIWHYEPDLMQVSVLRDIRDVDPAVMQLLGGRLGLADVHLLEAQPARHRYHVRLGDTTEVWIGLKDGRLDDVESRDELGNSNLITLSQLHMRPPAPGRFAFVVPKGVDVVPLH